MNKTAIRNFAIWARKKLIADISYRAGLIGITERGVLKALPQSTGTIEFYDIGSVEPFVISGIQVKQRQRLVDAINQKATDSDYKTAYNSIIEEVAFTWFNRLIALRFMEVNDYLPGHIRVLSSETGKMEPDLVTTPFDADLEFTSTEEEQIIQLKQDNKIDELFRMLFIKQCNALNVLLPALFEKTNDYTEILLNLSAIDQDGVIYHLVHDIPEEDFDVERGGQVEIIGWLYQYYNTELKDETFALLKENVKISKERIPSVTQLFTPDWIVKYLVENSLGKLWEDIFDNNIVPDNWKYYFDNSSVLSSKAVLNKLNIRDIKLIDPCMGSGHILVYAFDVFMQMYEQAGYSQRDAAKSIIENNLYGLDIDERAFQMAYFAVLMKARQYNRKILKEDVRVHLYCIPESNGFNMDHLKYLGSDLEESKRKEAYRQVQQLLDTFMDAKEYGSILQVNSYNWQLLRHFASSKQRMDQLSFDMLGLDLSMDLLLKVINIAEVMHSQYHVVITNPPYMGNKGFSDKLLKYIIKNYPEGKIDLYAVFIKRCSQMTIKNGIYAMVTPESWMFLSRFEKLRRPFLENNTFTSMLHLGFGAFDSGFGTVAFTAIKGDYRKVKATCYRLVDFSTAELKEQAIFKEKPYLASKDAFYLVDGVPFCYWVSDAMLNNFNEPKVKEYGKTCVGLLTGNNERFLRYWYEIPFNLLGIGYTHEQAKEDMVKKWYPINQYGEYRKWYGNNMIVFDWWKDGYNIKKFKMDRYLSGEVEKKNSMCWNEDTYFCPGITWNRISTSKFSARMSPIGNTAGSSSPIYFPISRKYYLLALFNSCVFSNIVQFLNPTVSFQTADIEKVPVIFGSNEVDELAKENVELAKEDWDSFETSYGFKRHPLV